MDKGLIQELEVIAAPIMDFQEFYEVDLTKFSLLKFREWLRQYGEKEVKTAVSIAIGKYDDAIEAFGKIGGILYNRSIKKELLFKKKEENDNG